MFLSHAVFHFSIPQRMIARQPKQIFRCLLSYPQRKSLRNSCHLSKLTRLVHASCSLTILLCMIFHPPICKSPNLEFHSSKTFRYNCYRLETLVHRRPLLIRSHSYLYIWSHQAKSPLHDHAVCRLTINRRILHHLSEGKPHAPLLCR